MTTISGTVKFFSAKRGYGFIIPDDPDQDGQEYFVHHSVIQGEGFRSLATGEEVQFEFKKDGDKLVALNVTGPGGNAVQGGSKPGGFKGGKKGGKSEGGGGKSGKGKGEGGKMALKGKNSSPPSYKGGWDRYDAPKGGKYGYRDDGFKGGSKGFKGYYDDYDSYDYGWGYKGKGYKGFNDYDDYKGGKMGKGFKGGYKGYGYDDYDDFDDYGFKGKGPPMGSKGGFKGFGGPSKGFKGDNGGFKGSRKGKYDYY